MIDAVANNEVDIVVVDEVTRIARSIRDLEDTIDHFEDAGVAVHFVSEGLEVDPNDDDPMTRAILQLMGVFGEMEARLTRQRIRDGIAARKAAGKTVGRTPLGFESDGGNLIPGDDYDRVATVLEEVDADRMSKRAAADELGCARATIRNALERREMYGLSAQ